MPGKEDDSFLYSQSRGSKKTYQSTPTGAFDIQRMIDGKPCWESHGGMDVPKKKTLIFNDWSYPYWTSNQPYVTCLAYEAKLQLLMRYGFSVLIIKPS